MGSHMNRKRVGKEGRNSRFLEFELHVFLHLERCGIVCPAMVSRRKEGSARGGRNKSRGSHKKRRMKNKKTDGFKTPKKETRAGETYIRISI
jgi:hypothetical protein